MQVHEGSPKTPEKPALVLFRPDRSLGLWDSEMSTLVDELEEELGVFVTCVGSGAGSLALEDAAAAARFMGCPSMIVIAPENSTTLRPGVGGDGGSRASDVFVRSPWSLPALVEAYLSSVQSVRVAA